MKIAPGATFTRLPHGGAVLVNATTLALTECGEPEAAIVEHLLSHGLPGPEETTQGRPVDGFAPPAVLRRMAEQLIESGWLLDDRRS